MARLMEPVMPLQEQAEKEAFPCRHCDDWVVENVYSEVWQYDNGHWRCADADTPAEPVPSE